MDEVQILAVGDGQQARPLRPLHTGPHHPGAGHRLAVVGHGRSPGSLQRDHVRELLPGKAPGDGGHRADTRFGPRSLVQNIANHFRRVGNRLRIRHTGYSGNAAGGSGLAAGQNILLVGEAGIPQVNVHVHQPRKQDLSPGVQDRIAGLWLQRPSHGGDISVRNPEAAGKVQPVRRADDPRVYK